jgi:Na+/phosphate symporter
MTDGGHIIAALQHYSNALQQRRKLMHFPDLIDKVYMTIIGGVGLAMGATGFISAVAACGGLPSYHVD